MQKKFALSALAAAVLLPAAALAADVTMAPISVMAAPDGVTSVFTFGVTGIASGGTLGDAANVVALLDIGAGSVLTSVGWSVSLTASSPSWLSEIAVQFSPSTVNQDLAISLAPSTSNAAGTASYTGSTDLVPANLSFAVGSDGLLRLEFYETYDDAGIQDGMWNSGTLTLGVTAVPEPGTYGLMALGMVGVLLAARRRAA
jgi:hypothetical protein